MLHNQRLNSSHKRKLSDFGSSESDRSRTSQNLLPSDGKSLIEMVDVVNLFFVMFAVA